MKTYKKLQHIKMLILDVDGVLTDGKLYISDSGYETKCFNVQDGIGLQLLLKNTIDVVIISGRKSKATKIRLHDLGIKHFYFGVDNKIKIYNNLKKKFLLKDENIVCVGDDIPDLLIMQQSGFSFAVANATIEIQKIADHITTKNGGDGAVREVCDIILTSKTQIKLCE